jgi:hypothetical protein
MPVISTIYLLDRVEMSAVASRVANCDSDPHSSPLFVLHSILEDAMNQSPEFVSCRARDSRI